MTNITSGRAFISYSYKDENELVRLEKILREQSVTPSPFPPIEIPPTEMVSNELIKSILECQSLIYIDTPNSRMSPWVTLEQEYARHIGKPTYSYEPITGRLKNDLKKPTVFPVYPSYSRDDNEKVRWIINFMREKRFFDIFIEDDVKSKTNIFHKIFHKIETMETGFTQRLERGGYLVLFWSKYAMNSEWVESELETIYEKYPAQVLVALLEKSPPLKPPLEDWRTSSVYRRFQSVHLYGDGPHGLDYRQVDNLIVKLYWLIQAFSKAKKYKE